MTRPIVMGDGLPPLFLELLGPDIEVLPWQQTPETRYGELVTGVITYGHPRVDGALLDRLPHVKVVSNHGVGVDHIDVPACAARKIPDRKSVV